MESQPQNPEFRINPENFPHVILTGNDIPTLTRHPKLVLTALVDRPRFANSFVKDVVR